MSLDEKYPLFIVGAPRSGTTFLTRLVNRFLDFHISRDAGVFLRFEQMLPHYGNLEADENLDRLLNDMYKDYFFRTRLIERGLTVSADGLRATLKERSYPALVAHILATVAHSYGKSGWGNKKPSYSLSLGGVDSLFPTARFVHIIRDGRDVALSMRQAENNLLERTWYFAARDWQRHVTEGRTMGQVLGPDRYMELRYEDLLSAPAESLTRILQLVGGRDAEIERLANARAQIGARVKAGNFNKWKTKIPDRGVRIIERVAGPLLSGCGYELAHPEESGKGFPPLRIWVFSAERIGRKLFTRNIQKAARYRTQRFLSAARALAGSRSVRRLS
jgi:sulfotransferase family protein